MSCVCAVTARVKESSASAFPCCNDITARVYGVLSCALIMPLQEEQNPSNEDESRSTVVIPLDRPRSPNWKRRLVQIEGEPDVQFDKLHIDPEAEEYVYYYCKKFSPLTPEEESTIDRYQNHPKTAEFVRQWSVVNDNSKFYVCCLAIH